MENLVNTNLALGKLETVDADNFVNNECGDFMWEEGLAYIEAKIQIDESK